MLDLDAQSPTIWAEQCPLNFHHAGKTNNGSFEEARNPCLLVPGRHVLTLLTTQESARKDMQQPWNLYLPWGLGSTPRQVCESNSVTRVPQICD